jgi:hypothetical protein
VADKRFATVQIICELGKARAIITAARKASQTDIDAAVAEANAAYQALLDTANSSIENAVLLAVANLPDKARLATAEIVNV